ncbi:MAG: CDP-alcohol phosphatidyltransferase family protein [Kiloniellaceae bacterium]
MPASAEPARASEGSVAAAVVDVGDQQVWCDTAANRLRRGIARVGVETVIEAADLSSRRGAVVLLRSDVAVDAPLLKALVGAPGSILLSNGDPGGLPVAVHAPTGMWEAATEVLRTGTLGDLPAGLTAVTSAELGASYWEALRKREDPYALVVRPDNLKRAEWRMFMGTYKGATDLVTKWLWPWPAFHATKLCARLGITPNQVTAVSLLLVIGAFYWFWEGNWLPGLLAAWGMTFLDTVDGKLARITLRSSKFGNVFDHSIDLIHPPFWYWAWGIGLQQGPLALSEEILTLCLAVIIAGYVLQRVIEGIAIWRLGLEIHVWRRVDTWFRLVTARRNPNLLLLTLCTAFGRPDLGLVLVAIWTAVCLALHGAQLLQGLAAARRGKLSSWLAGPA